MAISEIKNKIKKINKKKVILTYNSLYITKLQEKLNIKIKK